MYFKESQSESCCCNSQPIKQKTFETNSYICFQEHWVSDKGFNVTQEELVTALSNILSIHIRAAQDATTKLTTLGAFEFETTADQGSKRVYGQNICQCKAGYTGDLCTQCASGFTKKTDGTCGGCDCNGKSSTCDAKTGKCTFCTGNSMGKIPVLYQGAFKRYVTPYAFNSEKVWFNVRA